jgi:hypothetical protein
MFPFLVLKLNKRENCLRFQVLTAASMNTDFGCAIHFSFVEIYRRFRGSLRDATSKNFQEQRPSTQQSIQIN